jgi:hypothetical protein
MLTRSTWPGGLLCDGGEVGYWDRDLKVDATVGAISLGVRRVKRTSRWKAQVWRDQQFAVAQQVLRNLAGRRRSSF